MPGVLTSCLPLPAFTFALSLCDPLSVTAHPTPSDLLWPAWPQGTGNRGREERVTFLLLPASALSLLPYRVVIFPPSLEAS